MIRKSVDVIRIAAAEQRGYASQCIHAPKAKTKFLENAADLDRAADRLEELERITPDFKKLIPANTTRPCYTCSKCGLVAAHEEQPCPLCASRSENAKMREVLEIIRQEFNRGHLPDHPIMEKVFALTN